MTDHDDQSDAQVPFGRWLLTQRDRGDWVDGIANAARADRTFPKNGDPEAVRAHLRKRLDGPLTCGRYNADRSGSFRPSEAKLSIGVQKGPPIGVQKGPPPSSGVTGLAGVPFALVAA